LRLQAFAKLSYDELLAFLGVEKSSDRLWTFNRIKGGMSEFAMDFWENSPHLIEKGIIHAGKFEKFFRIFRRFILPMMHRKKAVEILLKKKSILEQSGYYYNVWDNLNWKIMFKIFFSELIVGRIGRDPEFFKYVDADVAGSFKKRTDFNFTNVSLYDNPYLNCIFTGNYPLHALPHYLRKENFEPIRSRLDRIEIYQGDINSCIERHGSIRFNAYNLSDIFEYMSLKEHDEELKYLTRGAAAGARFAFWNLLVDRMVPEGIGMVYEKGLSERLTKMDRAPFYKRFVVGTFKG
jgi:S-adenosylmethionine-diacylglycerol 3-amino-3-carboxypropyl transferase